METWNKVKNLFRGCSIWSCVGAIVDGLITASASLLFIIWIVLSLIVSLSVTLPLWLVFGNKKIFKNKNPDKHFLALNFSLHLFSTLAMFGVYPLAWVYEHIQTILFSDNKTWDLSKYYRNVAISHDQAANVAAEKLFNKILIEKDADYKFGHPDDTISEVVARNYYKKSLRIAGWLLAKILSRLGKNHLENAID